MAFYSMHNRVQVPRMCTCISRFLGAVNQHLNELKMSNQALNQVMTTTK